MRIGIFFGVSAPLAGACEFDHLPSRYIPDSTQLAVFWHRVCCTSAILEASSPGGKYSSSKVSRIYAAELEDSLRNSFLRFTGIITTGIGLLCFIIIPTDPERTRMLTPEEKALALARIDADRVVQTQGRKEPTTFRLIWKSFNINVSIFTWHGADFLIVSRRLCVSCVTSWQIFRSKDSVFSCPQ